MKRAIEKIVVLGAGTMGARIAAHVANAGVWCALLDMVPPEPNAEEKKRGLTVANVEVRNRIVRAGLAAAAKSRPAAFFTRGLENRIVTGNFDDDLKLCAEADWIIEVVAENLEIKRALLARVAQVRKPGAIVSTNTSGLPVRSIAEGLPEEWQALSDAAHRQARGIRGDNGAGFSHLRDTREQCALDLEIFRDDFDDPVRFGAELQIVVEIAGDDAIFEPACEKCRGPGFCGGSEARADNAVPDFNVGDGQPAFFFLGVGLRRNHVEQRAPDAGVGDMRGDPSAHGAGSEDHDFFDRTFHSV